MKIRRSAERGYADHGWLRSFHTFSFAGYSDPNFMGFHALRVINEDRVTAANGFSRHGHRDMEILSYVLEGSLAHKDSMGTSAVIRPGDVQRMTAGTGVMHSEQNGSKTEPVHFFQIWIVPDQKGHPPGYDQRHFADEEKRGRLRLVASADGREGSVTMHQDASLYAALLEGTESVTHTLGVARAAWVHVARGEVTVNGTKLSAGDAAAFEGGADDRTIRIEPSPGGEVLLFDLRAD